MSAKEATAFDTQACSRQTRGLNHKQSVTVHQVANDFEMLSLFHLNKVLTIYLSLRLKSCFLLVSLHTVEKNKMLLIFRN